MLASSDAKKQIDSDKPSSFRSLLSSLINNNAVSSILVGEIHDISPTLDAVLSNLDLLAASPRRVILITEDLNQSDNTVLKNALKKAAKEEIHSLKKMTFLKGKSIYSYQLIYASLSVGILVQGAENKKTNPFCDCKETELAVLRKMEAYQKSSERITVTNSEFAKLIHDFCSEGMLPLFIGGAAHVVALSSSDGPFDPGLQGRVKNSASIYLSQATLPSITPSFAYVAADRQLTGQYDYMVLTNKKALYEEALSSIDGLTDKIEYFIGVLDRLLHSYILYPHNASLLLPYDLNPVIEAFKENIAYDGAFESVHRLFESVLQEKEKPKEKENFLFFSLSKAPVRYTQNELALAVDEDLADFYSQSKIPSSCLNQRYNQ